MKNPGSPRTAQKFSKRTRRIIALTTISILILSLGVTAFMQQGWKTPAQEKGKPEAQAAQLREDQRISVVANNNGMQSPSVVEAVNNYVVTRQTGITYSSISGTGTSVTSWRNGTSTDDNLSNSQPIGFSLSYNGQLNTHFRVSTNGFITFNNATTATGAGSGATAYSFTNAQFSNSTATTANALAPFYDDQQTAGNLGTLTDLNNSIKYLTTGVAGSRVLTIEWINFQDFSTTSTASLNYQVKLYEADGHIEFVYGTMTPAAASWSYTLGINAATVSATPTAAELLTQQTANTATFSATPSNALSTVPTTNTQITLTPPATVPNAPTNLTFSNIAASSVQLNYQDNATNETGYGIEISTDGVNFTSIGTLAANTTAVTVTGLLASTNYTFRVRAVTDGQASAPAQNSVTTAAPPSGTKTIGAGGDYTTLTSAINDVNAGVGAGGVTFNVTAGTTFTENTPCITGGSASTPVVFQKSGAGANPIVQPTGGAGTLDAGICILGGDNITFDGIDVAPNGGANTNIEYGYIINNLTATNGAQNNVVKNAKITLNRANTLAIGIAQSVVAAEGGVTPTSAAGANSNNKYYNITVENSYKGIWLEGNSSFPDLTCEVGVTGGGTTTIGAAIANDIGNGSILSWGIRATSQSGVKIFNAEVRNVTVTAAVLSDGIFLDGFIGTNEVYNNNVHDIKNSSTSQTTGITGIRATHNTTGTNVARIYNNFVYGITSGYTGAASATRQIKGILTGSGGSTSQEYDIDFNSVRIDGSAALTISSTCFEIASTSGPVHKVRNNVFANVTGAQSGVAKHYTWVSTSASAIGNTGSVSDRNDLYVANTTNGFVGLGSATDRATLANWQTQATGVDTNSVSADPLFVSATNLHITNVASPASMLGSYFSGAITWVTRDIDNELRNGSTPDAGADQFNLPPANDIAATAILNPVPGSSINSANSFTPQASFTNVGTNNQTNVVVRFKILDAGSNVVYNQTQTIASFLSGAVQTISFPSTTVSAGSYTMSASAELAGDTNTANDTVSGSFSAKAPLNGNVNVGAGGAYTTLTAAIADLNTVGVSGPATLVLTDASYSTNETFPLTMNTFPGSSATNTLTIKPASGVSPTISGSSATTLLDFSGAKNVIINGSKNVNGTSKDLTISNTNTSGATLRFINAATNNTVKNSVLQGVTTSTSNGVVFFATVAAGTVGNSNNTVQNNDIRAGATAPAYGFYNSGTTTAKNATNLITQNRIFDFSNTGIRDDGNSSAHTYSLNEIFEVTTQSTALTGFRPSATSIDGLTFTQNYIHDLNTTSTSTVYGIQFFDTNGTAAVPVISNNMIALSATAPLTLRGIYDLSSSSENYKLYFNSIYLGGTVTGASTSECYYRSIASVSDVRDNIFVNARTGGTGKHYAIRTTTPLTSLTSDFNDIYNTGGTANVFGNDGTADRADLAAWRTATGKDTNSISANPQFASATDLHITRTAPGTPSPVENVGTSIGAVTTDFDGDTRAATPDIGADEVMTIQFSASTYAVSSGVSEGAGTATITVTRTSGAGAAATVNYATADGSATGGASCTAGVDYVTNSGTLSFAAGDTSKTFSITLCDDSTYEADETVNLSLSTVTGDAILGSPNTATQTINDNDTAPTISISGVTVSESAGTATFVVTQSAASAFNTTFNYSTADVTATAGSDYTGATNAPASINAGSNSTNISITILPDTIYEGDETFTVTLSNPNNATIAAGQGTATGTITDDDAAPSFSIDDVTHMEGNSGTTEYIFTITKTGTTAFNATVSYETVDGTATAPSDFTAIPTTPLTFMPGEAMKQVSVFVNGDTTIESNEAFTVHLSNAGNASIADADGTGTIENDDNNTNPTISDIPDQSTSQDNYVTASFTVGDAETTAADLTLTGSSGDQTLVPDANITFGGGGANRTVTVTPAAGQTGMATITVTVHDASNGTASDSFVLTVNPVTCYAPPFANMVSWYSAENNANDINGTNNGTLHGDTTYAAGKVNQAFSFDGNGDYVESPDSSTLSITGEISLDAWIKPNTVTTDGLVVNRNIVSKFDTNGQRSYSFDVLNGGALEFTVSPDGTSSRVVDTTGAVILPGVFTHVAVTFNPATQVTRIYVNGSEVTTTLVGSTTVNSIFDSTAPLRIGAILNQGGPQNDFNGLIDEVEIFNHVLTGMDINGIYIASSAGKCHTSTLQFSSATYDVNENVTPATITVTRTGAHDSAASVPYATADGTATGGASCGVGVDYQTASGTLNFAAGDVSKTFNVPICDDLIFEGDETVNLSLDTATGTGVTLGSPNTAVLTIHDDEGTPTMSINDVTFTGADSLVATGFTVTLSHASALPVTVHYATSDHTAIAGEDYNAASGMLTFTPGETTKDIPITILADNVNEPTEDFFIDLDTALGATITDGHGIGTIPNDDPQPSFSIDDVTHDEGNTGTTSYTFTVTKSGATSQTVTVDYATVDGTATDPSDYTAIPTTPLSFAPAEMTKQFTVFVNGDGTYEPNEAFTVHLSNASGASISDADGTGTITNDDPQPSLSVNDVTFTGVDSRPSSISGFTVTLSNPSSSTVTVHYATSDDTAVAGEDYTAASGTLTFDPGDTTKTVSVTILPDTTNEPTEDFFIDLDTAVGATIGDGHGIGTIPNDDPLPSMTISDAIKVEGDEESPSVMFTVTLSNPSSEPVTAQFTTVDGSATTADEDYTSTTGTVGFQPNQTTQTISVQVTGDIRDEGNETFSVVLSDPSGATIADNTGVCTIIDDDTNTGNFDGDGQDDLSVFRPSAFRPGESIPNGSGGTSAVWYILNSGGGVTEQQFGVSTDIPVAGDYDGDGKKEIAVFRPSEGAWYIWHNTTHTFTRIDWGLNGDVPVPGDYDGDRKTDIAVFRPSDGTWYIRKSTNDQLMAVPWGFATDRLVPADYDGDGKIDIAVFRPSNGNWYILKSTDNQLLALQWGVSTDKLVPADYDLDGKADVAVWRPSEGTFYVLRSSTGTLQAQVWGVMGDVPVVGDYDNDGKADFAVWRPATGIYSILFSSDGSYIGPQWGSPDDIPVASRYVPEQ